MQDMKSSLSTHVSNLSKCCGFMEWKQTQFMTKLRYKHSHTSGCWHPDGPGRDAELPPVSGTAGARQRAPGPTNVCRKGS